VGAELGLVPAGAESGLEAPAGDVVDGTQAFASSAGFR
jgi:hypothetical protein